MNVINELVYHRQFGSGTITGQTMTTVTVEFCEEYGIKKFLCPSAFESFLALCDPDVRQKMDNVLKENHEREALARQQRAEEEERNREEERRILLEQKRTAAKKNLALRNH